MANRWVVPLGKVQRKLRVPAIDVSSNSLLSKVLAKVASGKLDQVPLLPLRRVRNQSRRQPPASQPEDRRDRGTEADPLSAKDVKLDATFGTCVDDAGPRPVPTGWRLICSSPGATPRFRIVSVRQVEAAAPADRKVTLGVE